MNRNLIRSNAAQVSGAELGKLLDWIRLKDKHVYSSSLPLPILSVDQRMIDPRSERNGQRAMQKCCVTMTMISEASETCFHRRDDS